MKKALQILLGLVGAIFIICAATTVTLNFTPLYKADIEHYHLKYMTGLSEDEIFDNYKAMIDYNNIGGPETLEFPTFPMSEGGRIHFEDVRRVFQAMEYAMIICGIILLFGIIYMERKKLYFYRLAIAVFTVALPAIAGIYAALSWDTFFVTFHHLLFNNDYWIFDPVLDPVITILPDGFFLHCLVMIVVLALIGAAIFGLLFKLRFRRK